MSAVKFVLVYFAIAALALAHGARPSKIDYRSVRNACLAQRA